jgi:hypothetical protein
VGSNLDLGGIQGKMLTMTPPIWFYAEMRIAISSSKGIIKVRVFKFVNDVLTILLFENACGHASVFQMWVKCRHSHKRYRSTQLFYL